MCCFSGPFVPLSLLARLFGGHADGGVRVSATNIFARMVRPGVQAIAYSMNLDTAAEVAMVLPIPIAPGTGAIEFVDLSKFPKLFEDLAHLFAVPQRKGGFRFSLGGGARVLPVFEVGAFVASFVPARADFARLDPRFRLDDRALAKLPADYGFAVFQLKPGKQTVHPMAFTFATREPTKLFFPTTHVHAGDLPARAKFDHTLYFQNDHTFNLSFMVACESYNGLVEPGRHVARQILRGRRRNTDVWI